MIRIRYSGTSSKDHLRIKTTPRLRPFLCMSCIPVLYSGLYVVTGCRIAGLQADTTDVLTAQSGHVTVYMSRLSLRLRLVIQQETAVQIPLPTSVAKP